MNTVLVILGILFCVLLFPFLICSCRLAGKADQQAGPMFAHWLVEHTEDEEEGAAV